MLKEYLLLLGILVFGSLFLCCAGIIVYVLSSGVDPWGLTFTFVILPLGMIGFLSLVFLIILVTISKQGKK